MFLSSSNTDLWFVALDSIEKIKPNSLPAFLFLSLTAWQFQRNNAKLCPALINEIIFSMNIFTLHWAFMDGFLQNKDAAFSTKINKWEITVTRICSIRMCLVGAERTSLIATRNS